MAVTRCTTTRFAITIYFCGVEIARNIDHDLPIEKKMKSMISKPFGIGTASLIKFLKYWYEDKNENDEREMIVLRLGVGQKERSKPPQEHVWSIVCKPDGTCNWYQSYIMQYSLFEWMDHIGDKSLSITNIINRFEKLNQLSNVKEWNYEANTLYKELFWVDIINNDNTASQNWDYTKHRLNLNWNIAC